MTLFGLSIGFSTWVLLAASIASCGGFLVWFSFSNQQASFNRRFAQIVCGNPPEAELARWFQRLVGRPSEGDDLSAGQREVLHLLACTGWRDREAYSVFVVIRAALPLIAVALFWGFTSAREIQLSGTQLVLRSGIAASLGYLAPGFVLRRLAQSRAARVAEEVGSFAELLCVLFDAGLSLEQSLRVIARDAQSIVEELQFEIELVLRQIGAGAQRAEALAMVTEDLHVPELSALVRLLCQIERHGGAVQEPMRQFCLLYQDRRRTQLQEAVSKLSAKMTVVMILFLFPALLVFIGGPGFIALKRALEGAGG